MPRRTVVSMFAVLGLSVMLSVWGTPAHAEWVIESEDPEIQKLLQQSAASGAEAGNTGAGAFTVQKISTATPWPGWRGRFATPYDACYSFLKLTRGPYITRLFPMDNGRGYHCYIRHWLNIGGDFYGALYPRCEAGEMRDPTAESGCSPVVPEKEFGDCDDCQNTRPSGGNPVYLHSGTNYERVTDYRSAGPDVLEFTRYYNSRVPRLFSSLTYRLRQSLSGNMGYGWRHNFSRGYRIWGPSYRRVLILYRGDGKGYTFRKHRTHNIWFADPDVPDRLQPLPGGGWRLTDENDTVEHYDSSFRLLSITRRNGYTQTMQYDGSGRFSGVVDSHGRELKITSFGGRVTSMTDPDGREYRYEYDSYGLTGTGYSGGPGGPRSRPYASPRIDFGIFNLPLHNSRWWRHLRLRAVIYPDGTDDPNDNPTLSYQYQDPRRPALLTGKVDESGRRTTWAYDRYGRAVYNARGPYDPYRNGFRSWTRYVRTFTAGDPITVVPVPQELDLILGSPIEDAVGRPLGEEAVRITYGPNQTRTLVNALGLRKEYRFAWIHGQRRLAKVDRYLADGTHTGFREVAYDSRGYPLARRTWNGELTRYTYNTRGLLERVTETAETADARTVTTTWHPALRVPTRIVEPGRVTDMTYDSRGLMLTRIVTDTTTNTAPYSTYGQQRVWTYSYTPDGLLETVDGPRTDVADVTTFQYDNGDLVRVTNALGHAAEVIALDASGRPLEIVDANGVVTGLGYDARGRLVSATVDATGAPSVTEIDYDDAGRIAAMILPDGSTLFYGYDEAGRLAAILNDDGERIEYGYDAMGNATSRVVKSPDGAITRSATSVFDSLGRLTASVGAAGQTTSYAYNNSGSVTAVTDPNGNPTGNVFDSLNRLLQSTDALGGVGSYDYDRRDNLIAATDQRGLTTTYVYNGFDEAIQVSSPDAGASVFIYDSDGNMVSATDARGVVTQYDYDALGRPTVIRYPADPSENVTYTYDDPTPGAHGIGRAASVTDDSGSTAWRYDARGNMVRETRVIEGASYVTRYTYDTANRMVSMTYPSGRVVDYPRDALGRVASVAMRDGLLGPVTPLASGLGYEAMGGLNALTHGNGVQLNLAYDLDGRLAALDAHNGATPVLDLDYVYDPASNITAIADTGGGPRSQSFAYDPLHRLTGASGTYNAGFAGPPPGVGKKPAGRGPAQFPGMARAPIAQGDIAYSYDSVGNRTARQMTLGRTTTTESYAYGADSNRLLSVESTGGQRNLATTRDISYGDSGNTLADTKDGRDLAFAYDQSDRLVSVSAGGVEIARYVHNALGQRVVKQVGLARTHYLYDVGGRLIAEVDARAGSVLVEYVWLGGVPLATVLGGGMATYHVHADHLGTPQVLSDAGGRIAWSAVYRPFGETASAGGRLAGGAAFNLRFPGQYYDAETGLHYNYFRDYDPSTGRYVQSDPIGLGGSFNVYAYVGGNPMRFSDYSGLKVEHIDPQLNPYKEKILTTDAGKKALADFAG